MGEEGLWLFVHRVEEEEKRNFPNEECGFSADFHSFNRQLEEGCTKVAIGGYQGMVTRKRAFLLWMFQGECGILRSRLSFRRHYGDSPLGNHTSAGNQSKSKLKEDAMRLLRAVIPVFLLALFVFWGCEQEPPVAEVAGQQSVVTTSVNDEAIALEVMGLTGWEVEGDACTAAASPLAKVGHGKHVIKFDRIPLGKGIMHYNCEIRVGPGFHDKIGLHRVVKESIFNHPNKSKDAIFLLHGDAKDFQGMFLPGTLSDNTPDNFGLAFYLAENNVDVWGIDQGWAIVPAGTSDFTFMKDWGLQRNIDDLRTAIGVARMLRFLTGNGYDKMILLGYSSGGVTGYATLNHETQLPPLQRHIRGFVPADILVKTNDEAMKQAFVNDLTLYEPPYDANIYQADIPFQPVAQLARTDPDGDSPFFPGFTNMQLALWFGAGQIWGDGVTAHYLAGVMNGEGFPVDLMLITVPQWLDFMAAGTPYEANKFIIDYDKIIGEIGENPFDDHLSEIQVPIFNLGTRGGFGPYTAYGLTLLGSTDITSLLVEVGTGNILTEFAHIDLFIAPQAPNLAWKPLLNWLQAHRN